MYLTMKYFTKYTKIVIQKTNPVRDHPSHKL